ncbi:ATP-binding protein [Pseudonocardia sp.]|uniref:ATP-binding protein n=1 Tax=Pseudonocardia sp. TaxID=60912 RepID=UPI0039C8E05D
MGHSSRRTTAAQGAANLFFQLIATRYEQASVMVTSNLPFGKSAHVRGGAPETSQVRQPSVLASRSCPGVVAGRWLAWRCDHGPPGDAGRRAMLSQVRETPPRCRAVFGPTPERGVGCRGCQL